MRAEEARALVAKYEEAAKLQEQQRLQSAQESELLRKPLVIRTCIANQEIRIKEEAEKGYGAISFEPPNYAEEIAQHFRVQGFTSYVVEKEEKTNFGRVPYISKKVFVGW